ncbi:MAG: hypothetical protein DWB44_00055 [Chloroflexi bacterium]|jgi:hypothetical protein|nr:hypothetical protein [Chloroflexota bacterium]GIK29392.1 MAG: hypothetical protein BroJett007_25300 [Chloroflexota bacterium]
MAGLMGLTAILPALAPQTASQQAIQPTATPQPTVPPPPADLSAITFDNVYLHPSALYMVNYPDGWEPTRPSNNGTQVQVNFENNTALSIIETYIEFPAEPPANLQDLSARYDENTLQRGWSRYNSWKEVDRTLDTEQNAVVIDFELMLRSQTYLARHVAKLTGDGKIYVTRVVTPSNARALLLDLLAKAEASITPVALYEGTPVQWNGYYSAQDNMVVRYPNNWVLRDGGPGEPVTIEGSGQGVLHLESVAGTVIADEDAAREFVAAMRPDAEIRTVEAVERNGGSGFAVSYAYRTLEGEPQSAVAVLLNDAGDTLRVATVRVHNYDVDLLTTEPTVAAVTDAAQVARMFNLTTGLGFPPADEDSAEAAG